MNKFLNKVINTKDYIELFQTNSDDIPKVLEELKKEYMDTHSKVRCLGLLNNETNELLNHSEQSELIGKIAMLCHEFGGYELLVSTINELFFKFQDKITDRMLEMEKEIEHLKSSNKA